jgi:hypothetical protein
MTHRKTDCDVHMLQLFLLALAADVLAIVWRSPCCLAYTSFLSDVYV